MYTGGSLVFQALCAPVLTWQHQTNILCMGSATALLSMRPRLSMRTANPVSFACPPYVVTANQTVPGLLYKGGHLPIQVLDGDAKGKGEG